MCGVCLRVWNALLTSTSQHHQHLQYNTRVSHSHALRHIICSCLFIVSYSSSVTGPAHTHGGLSQLAPCPGGSSGCTWLTPPQACALSVKPLCSAIGMFAVPVLLATISQLQSSFSRVLGACGDLAWAKGEGKDHTGVLLVLLSASTLLPLLHRPAFLASDFQPPLTH